MAKTITGIVSSDKGDKTILVTIHDHKIHPLYKKQYLVTKRYMVHDEKNEAVVGDKVSIMSCRPLSARKRYTLIKIVEHPIISVDQSVDAITAEEPKEEVIKEKPIKNTEDKADKEEPKTEKKVKK